MSTIFETKAHINNGKNCYTAISPPHVLTGHNMVNFDPLAAEIG